MLVWTNEEMELGFKEVNNAGKIRSPLDKEGGPGEEWRGLCRVHLTVWLNNERFLQMRLAQGPFAGLHFYLRAHLPAAEVLLPVECACNVAT